MILTRVDIAADGQLAEQVRALYREAFPKEERLPWWLLRLNSMRKGIELTAWLDGEVFCGFTSAVTVEDFHMLLYFAVVPSLRGKGYGSAILAALKEAYGTVALHVEPLEKTAPNYPQRLRRYSFYRRNGFADAGWDVWEVGGRYRILASRCEPVVSAYPKAFRRLTFGLWDGRLKQAEEGEKQT